MGQGHGLWESTVLGAVGTAWQKDASVCHLWFAPGEALVLIRWVTSLLSLETPNFYSGSPLKRHQWFIGALSISLFIYFVEVLGFEVTASCLVGRYSIT